jgi:hypothetical protein
MVPRDAQCIRIDAATTVAGLMSLLKTCLFVGLLIYEGGYSAFEGSFAVFFYLRSFPALPSVQGRIYAPKTLHQYKWVAIDEQCILWTREKRRGALVHPLIEMTDQVRQCRIVLHTHAERIAAAKLLARQRTPLC